ncbi:MAG: peptide chain release factor N(5)-glutamine methyltransferase [Muribaculaceae bacterium]|nr:peptide chain release factor N(5)-glutamine methyltransferase [Muribaculaceae bacterium]MDE6028244.1 peptide chain release factor N(5)-glutamine methyltransferase [Muribaculaceae bacterium]
MTLKEKVKEIRGLLSPLYGEGEAKAMTRLIFHSLKGWNATDMIIHEGDEISGYISGKIDEIIKCLENHEPIQYILGEAYFYGMDLKVDRSVLIPRPETEELVDMIVKEWSGRQDLRVLDIGTGSGAIAIALSRNLPFSKVEAIDISKEALSVAEGNARKMKARIAFRNEDVFVFSPDPDSFDIIVSNPPYIDESEKAAMDRNVLDYEPHTALFVPDDNPLIFYSRIATIAAAALVDGGMIYLEINPRHCEEMKELLANEGFTDIEAVKDMYGKERFVTAKK